MDLSKVLSYLDPSGTTGPQITPRNEGAPELRPLPRNDLPIIDDKRMASNRPVIVAQIPPPINRMSRPPHPGGAPPNQQVKRNAPVRSQSMGVADTGRFYMKPVPIGGPPPRFRPPPPPDERRPLVNRRVEYIETSSDGEDAIFDPIVPDYRSWDRRKTNYGNQGLTLNQKYKTLEPRSKSGGDAQSLERLNNNRRILPEVPSHSLPRPGKRTQSDSRSRDRPGVETKRSQSHGDGIGEQNRRKLPTVPGKLDRDIREPTPDYDTSPPPSECSRLTGRRNSDSGLLSAGRADHNQKITVKRHASSVEKVGRRLLNSQSSPENNIDSDDSVNKDRECMTNLLEDEDSSCISICNQSNTGVGIISEELPSISSLHDYHSSVDTNFNQYSGANIRQQNSNDEYNLVPIDEEDEDNQEEDKEGGKLEECSKITFSRGGFGRSTIRNSKKKNFKDLKINMDVVKNNHANDQKEDFDNRKMKNEAANSMIHEEFSNVSQARNDEDSNNLVPKENTNENLLKGSSISSKQHLRRDHITPDEHLDLNPPSTSSTISSTSRSNYESMTMELSLSEDEEIFNCLSIQISKNMSEDEEEFDRISMQIELDNVEEKFNETFNENPCKEMTKENIKTIGKKEKEHSSEDNHEKMDKYNSNFLKKESETILRTSNIRSGIAYWEKRSSADNFNEPKKAEIFRRGSLQRSSIRKTKQKNRDFGVENKCPKLSNSKDDQTKEGYEKKSVSLQCSENEPKKRENLDMEVKKEEDSTTDFEILPTPAPRKSLIAKEDKCSNIGVKYPSYLPQIDVKYKSRGNCPIIFSIKTWEERGKEGSSKPPEKVLLEWF